MQLYKYDPTTKLFAGVIIYEEEFVPTNNTNGAPPQPTPRPVNTTDIQPIGLHDPKWDGVKWVENKSITALLDIEKQAKINELNMEYDMANDLDVSYMGNTFAGKPKDRTIISEILSIGSVPTGFYFRSATNVDVPMTYAQLQGLAKVILTKNQSNFVKRSTLKKKILAAVDLATLNTIVIKDAILPIPQNVRDAHNITSYVI